MSDNDIYSLDFLIEQFRRHSIEMDNWIKEREVEKSFNLSKALLSLSLEIKGVKDVE